MARQLTTAQENAIQSGNVILGFLYEAEFPNEYLRAWSGYEERQFDSDGDGNDETFYPVGEFGSIGEISEEAEVRATGFSVQLSGVPTEDGGDTAIDEALHKNFHGLDAKLWLVLLDSDYNFIDDPIKINSGFQDDYEVNDSANTVDITVNIENPLRNLRGKSTLHYTQQDLQSFHSDDRFFDHVEQIQNKQVKWGPD